MVLKEWVKLHGKPKKVMHEGSLKSYLIYYSGAWTLQSNSINLGPPEADLNKYGSLKIGSDSTERSTGTLNITKLILQNDLRGPGLIVPPPSNIQGPGLIVPPEQQQQNKIKGPPQSDIEESGIIAPQQSDIQESGIIAPSENEIQDIY